MGRWSQKSTRDFDPEVNTCGSWGGSGNCDWLAEDVRIGIKKYMGNIKLISVEMSRDN